MTHSTHVHASYKSSNTHISHAWTHSHVKHRRSQREDMADHAWTQHTQAHTKISHTQTQSCPCMQCRRGSPPQLEAIRVFSWTRHGYKEGQSEKGYVSVCMCQCVYVCVCWCGGVCVCNPTMRTESLRCCMQSLHPAVDYSFHVGQKTNLICATYAVTLCLRDRVKLCCISQTYFYLCFQVN